MSCSLMHLADTAGHPQVHPQVNTKCLFPNFSIYHKTGFPRIDRFTALYFNIHPYQAADKSPGPGRLTTSQAGSRHLSVINKSQNPILNRQPYSVTKKLPRDFSSSQTIQPRAFTESQLSADTDSVPYAAATPKMHIPAQLMTSYSAKMIQPPHQKANILKTQSPRLCLIVSVPCTSFEAETGCVLCTLASIVIIIDSFFSILKERQASPVCVS